MTVMRGCSFAASRVVPRKIRLCNPERELQRRFFTLNQLIFAVLLLILGVLVAVQGVQKFLEKPEAKKAAA